MATDPLTINKFEVCRKFNLSKYVCELPPERRQCDGICIKAPLGLASDNMDDVVKEGANS